MVLYKFASRLSDELHRFQGHSHRKEVLKASFASAARPAFNGQEPGMCACECRSRTFGAIIGVKDQAGDVNARLEGDKRCGEDA